MSKPLAVVTGASSGIGFELAKQLAERGYDLVIASNTSDLDAAARAVTGAGGDVVKQVHADLATSDGVERLAAEVKWIERPVDVLALNAGVGMSGRFVDSDLG